MSAEPTIPTPWSWLPSMSSRALSLRAPWVLPPLPGLLTLKGPPISPIPAFLSTPGSHPHVQALGLTLLPFVPSREHALPEEACPKPQSDGAQPEVVGGGQVLCHHQCASTTSS